MSIQGIEEALLISGSGLEAVRGREPLVDFRLLGVAVGEVGKRRHCSAEMGCKPGGSAWEDSCGEQLGVCTVVLEG